MYFDTIDLILTAVLSSTATAIALGLHFAVKLKKASH